MGHKYIFLAAVHFLSDVNKREKTANWLFLFGHFLFIGVHWCWYSRVFQQISPQNSQSLLYQHLLSE